MLPRGHILRGHILALTEATTPGKARVRTFGNSMKIPGFQVQSEIHLGTLEAANAIQKLHGHFFIPCSILCRVPSCMAVQVTFCFGRRQLKQPR